MQIPAYLITGLQNFLTQLDALMLTAGCSSPVQNDTLIEDKDFSGQPDFRSLQLSYSVIWVILEKILPIIQREIDPKLNPLLWAAAKAKQAAEIISAALNFDLKARIAASEISGQWSYYAACEFAATMEELGEQFNKAPDDDTVTKEIRELFQSFDFDPDTLVGKIAIKLCKNLSVQRDYENLRDQFTSLEQSLATVETNIASLPEIANYQPDLLDSENAINPASKYLAQQQEELTTLTQATKKLAISLEDAKLASSINALPKKMLLLNKEGSYYFENAPILNPVLSRLSALKKVVDEKQVPLKKVTENQRYFKQVYDDIITRINLIKKGVTKLPEQTYSTKEHQEYLTYLADLKTIDFSPLIQGKLPQPEYVKESENIQQAFSQLVEQQKETLTKEILTKQKQCFNAQLKRAVEETFTSACRERQADRRLTSEAIDECHGDETQLDKLQAVYSDYDNWLKGQLSGHNLKNMAEKWVRDTLNNDEAAQQLLREFLSGESYKILSKSIKELAKPLEKVIADGQLKLDTANIAKTEKLKIEVGIQEKRISEYAAALENANQTAQTLNEQHQLNYQTETVKLEEKNNTISQLLDERKKLTNTLNVSPIDLNSLSTFPELIKSDEIYQPIREQTRILEETLSALIDASKKITNESKQVTDNKTTIEQLRQNTIKTIDEIAEENNRDANRNKLTHLIKQLEETERLWISENNLYKQIHLLLTEEKNSRFPGSMMGTLKEDCIQRLDKKIQFLDSTLRTLQTKKQNSDNKEGIAENNLTSYQEIFSKLKETDKKLLGMLDQKQKIEKDLQALRTSQAEEIGMVYKEPNDYLPEGTLAPQGKESQTHQRNLSTMRCELNIKKATIGLIELKNPTVKHQANLNEIEQSLNNLHISPAAFKQNPNSHTSFTEQWQAHSQQINTAITTSQQNSIVINNQLTTAETENAKLFQQLDSVTQILEQTVQDIRTSQITEPSVLPSLINAKDNAHNELIKCKEKIDQQHRLREQKEKELAEQKTIHQQEILKAQAYQTHLLAAEQCKTDIGAQANLLTSQHQYDANTIVDLSEGRKSVDFEDQFYLSCRKSCFDLQKKILELKNLLAIPPHSELDQAFNQKLNTKINESQTQLDALNTTRGTQQRAWQDLSHTQKIIRDLRQVIADKSRNPSLPKPDYTNFDLRGIKLDNRNFANTPLQNVNFAHATLTNCTFEGSLEGVNFGDADVSTCNFNKANFKGVRLNAGTRIHWQYGYEILCDNLANPHLNADQTGYLTELVASIRQQKAGGISGKWVLGILKEIAAAKRPNNIDEKDHLRAQQERAVFFMQQIVPHLSIDAVLGLHDLVAKKHDGDKNPYGFIRRELDVFRMKYGNTKPWETIITLIKEKLLQHKGELQEKKRKLAVDIMRTQTAHTGGFGGFGKIYNFFNAIIAAKEWEPKEKENEKNKPEPPQHKS